MGGFGSGRRREESSKQTTDELPALDVRELKRRGFVDPGQEELEDVAHIAWTPCNFGGSRPWFICPGEGCGRRAAILYGAGDHWWLCRSCRNLAYASQREDRLDRAKRRIEKARRCLAPDGGRPKGMRHATFLRLTHEYLEARREYVAYYRERLAKLSEPYPRRSPGVAEQRSR